MQADLLTFAANHVYGTSVLTCLTAQNPNDISAIAPTQSEHVAAQADAISSYFTITAAKTGMLLNREIIEVAVAFFSRNPKIKLVVDPVVTASSGKCLLEDSAIYALKTQLLPLSEIITPNLDEAEILYGEKLKTPERMKSAAVEMAKKWNTAVLIKGGHMKGDLLHDILSEANGNVHSFTQNRIHSIDTHGSGCTLSAAIASQLAKGSPIVIAVSTARAYLRRAMESPIRLQGKRFINHFPQ